MHHSQKIYHSFFFRAGAIAAEDAAEDAAADE